jgi:ABC-2 type transport system permease protein
LVSDGDIIRNQFRIPSGEPLPLGYDQYTRETFGNKTFILNAMNYLIDGPGLISLRSREITLRLLDKTKINNSRIKWQVFNIAAPLVFIILLATVMIWLRKRKYSR